MKALTMMFGYENLCIDIVEAYMLKYDCTHSLFRGTINVLGIFSFEKKQNSQAAGQVVKCMIEEAMIEASISRIRKYRKNAFTYSGKFRTWILDRRLRVIYVEGYKPQDITYSKGTSVSTKVKEDSESLLCPTIDYNGKTCATKSAVFRKGREETAKNNILHTMDGGLRSISLNKAIKNKKIEGTQ
ncbi:hypothetical protein Tco_0850789 [Tanacetum coccineum]